LLLSIDLSELVDVHGKNKRSQDMRRLACGMPELR